MKTIKNIASFIGIAGIVSTVIYMIIFKFTNSDFTETQLMIEFFPMLIPFTIFTAIMVWGLNEN